MATEKRVHPDIVSLERDFADRIPPQDLFCYGVSKDCHAGLTNAVISEAQFRHVDELICSRILDPIGGRSIWCLFDI